MKKSIFFLFLNFFLYFFVAGENIKQQKFSQYIEYGYAYSAAKSIERDLLSFFMSYDLVADNFDINLFTQTNELLYDFTFTGNYFPLKQRLDTRKLYYGLGVLYHFQNYDSISNENDFIFDTCFKIKTDKHFSFMIKGGFHFKLTDVFVLDDYLTDKCPCLVFYFEKLFNNGMEIYWNFGSHDNYRYPLFVSPQYTLGFAYTSRNNIRIGADGEIRFSDQFTTAPYVNMLVFRSSFRILF